MARASFDFSGTTTVVTGDASGSGLTCAELSASYGINIQEPVSAHYDSSKAAGN